MGEHFGDYEIEARIGSGGMAEVYVATRRGQEGFAKRVCLKRVLAGAESDADSVRQFQDEARLAAHLHHPRIAEVHDLGQVDGKWFMSMELVEGLDLRAVIGALRARGERAPDALVLQVAHDVATALGYAHGLRIDGRPLGIVHRDVTPSNVLVSIHGEIKLADFGIARAATRVHRTRTGVVKGKVPYMAPEQALGEALDGRTDLFALGVLLYELCAGLRPHDGATELDTLTNARKGRRTPLSQLAPSAPFELVSLIDRLLAPTPSGRPSDAGAVLAALGSMPPPANARAEIAKLVLAARDPRSGATLRRGAADASPATRARGRRAPAVGALAPALDGPTVVTPAPRLDGGETESAQGAAFTGSTWLTRAASSRHLQFALGFGTVFTAGALLLGVIGLGVFRDQIARELAPTESSAAVRSADDHAPKPAAVTLEPTTSAPPAALPVEAPPEPPDHPARPSTPSRTGRLAVVVVPFGDVEIDGVAAGRSPVTASVTEGEHTIVVASGERRIERRARVERGRAQRVVVDLLDDP